MGDYHRSAIRVPRIIVAPLLCLPLIGCKMTNDTNHLPRNISLPLFDPHSPDFVCEVETTKVPQLDAQADAWFLEARALEEPGNYLDKPDYKKIVQLTRQAAERRHWKAMLKLASLYVENRDPVHGVEDAVELVETAMRLGVPAAFDRMGTYYKNGTGVEPNATRAYAFWQKAAEMGNPHAMAFLGEKLRAGQDGAIPGYWANIPVATKMLACAASQGHGAAAYHLHSLYAVPRAANGYVIGDRTRETKARALKVLHEGVKFGCDECARDLAIEFGSPSDLAEMLPPYVDNARAERYAMLRDALGYNAYRRFPNLDRVLPLPPADLPPWDGKRETLLAGAMAVKPPPSTPSPTAASQATGRYFLEAAYGLRKTDETTSEPQAPMAGYWRPTAPHQSAKNQALLEMVTPGLYGQGEAFEKFHLPSDEGQGFISGVIWEYWLTVRHDHAAISPSVANGLAREVARPAAFSSGVTDPICPATGIWQPWVHDAHPLSNAVIQSWRQMWLREGEAFPQPRRDWMLPLQEEEMAWYLMDASGADIG